MLFTPCFSLIFFKNKVPLRTPTVNESKKNKSSLSQWKGKFKREDGNCLSLFLSLWTTYSRYRWRRIFTDDVKKKKKWNCESWKRVRETFFFFFAWRTVKFENRLNGWRKFSRCTRYYVNLNDAFLKRCNSHRREIFYRF